MVKYLINHHWKETIRSVVRYQNAAANTIFGIFMALMVLNFLAIGLFIDRIFEDIAPEKDPIQMFNSFMLYYFLIDLIFRFFLQKIPTQSIKPYLHLPIRKVKIIRFLLAKSFISFFNLMPLFILIPFAIKMILPVYSLTKALIWLGSVFILMLCNSSINFFFQKQMGNNLKLVFAYILLLFSMLLLDYYSIISVSAYSGILFKHLLTDPFLIFIPVILFILIYVVNYFFLKKHSYIEELRTNKSNKSQNFNQVEYFDRFGEVGKYISLELKLLVRNKRSRSTIFFTLAFLLWGLLIYNKFEINKEYYPKPSTEAFQEVSNQKNGSPQITFQVTTQNLTDTAHVYIVGNHKKIGKWKSSATPLIKQDDGSWIRTFSFDKGIDLEYTFSLGSRETQRIDDSGDVFDYSKLTVKNDTTITAEVPGWQKPKRPFMVEFNLIYSGILIIGFLMIAYGQFLYCWESNYFDFILSKKINMFSYLKAKYIIMVMLTIVFYVLALPYALFGIGVLKINTAIFIYNLGVNPYVLIFLATLSRKRMDLSSSIIATQGKGANQYLTMLPTIILPILIYLPFWYFYQPDLGFLFLAILGIMGILFNKQLLKMSIFQFNRQKYKMAAGFRSS